jgi:flagellar protein FliS
MPQQPYPPATGTSSPGHHYLRATIETASPARLRLMLIERAVEVAAGLAMEWRAGRESDINSSSLRLLDLLTELLRGVRGGTDAENRLGRQVADLYVFLIQHLLAAEQDSNSDAIDEIRLVLETEAETWRLVCAQDAPQRTENRPRSKPSLSRLNLEG